MKFNPGALSAVGAWAVLTFSPGAAIKDPDTPWHVRTGDLAIENISSGNFGPVQTEPFSWTVNGHPWQANGWGFDVLSSIFFEASWVGLAVFRMILLGILVFLMWKASEGFTPWVRGWSVALSSIIILPFVEMRPQLLSFICFLLAWLLVKKILQGNLRQLWWLGLVSVLWANFHGAVAAGVGLLGLYCLGWVILNRRWKAPLAIGATFIAGTFFTPFGVGLWTYAFATREDSFIIEEWRHASFSSWRDIVVFSLALAAIFVVMRSKENRRENLPQFLMILGALALSLDAVRNEAFIALTMIPFFGLALTSLKGYSSKLPVSPKKLLVVVLTVGILSGFANLKAQDITQPRVDRMPVEAAKLLPEDCKLLNDYTSGGYLILARPDLKVSQDGRNDVYGSDIIIEQAYVFEGKTDLSYLDENDITCILVQQQRELIDQLEASSEWRFVGEDPVAEVWVRN